MNTLEDTLNQPQRKNKHWLRNLRILGLSDREQWLKNANKCLHSNWNLPRAIRFTHSNALNVLGDLSKPIDEYFEAPVLLVTQDRDESNMDIKMFNHGLVYSRNEDLFDTSVWGYSFSHRFIKLRKGEGYTLSSIHIDEYAIHDTIDAIWIESFKKLEKSLWALYLYANHDYSMHRYGMWLSYDPLAINNIFKDYFENNLPKWIAWSTELCSAMFHRDMLEDMSEKGLPIYESIEKQARVTLGEIEKLENPELKKYWMMVIKYPLFSIIDPTEQSIWDKMLEQGNESSEIAGLMNLLKPSELEVSDDALRSSDSIAVRLRKEFPDLNLKATAWWKAVHQKNAIFDIWLDGEKQYIAVRKLREIAMDWLRSQDEGTEQKLAQKIASLAWYTWEIDSWNDLYRISKARNLWLSDDTSSEYIRDLDSYHNTLADLRIMIQPIEELWEDFYGLNILSLRKTVLDLTAKWFDFSEFDEIDGTLILEAWFKRRIELKVREYSIHNYDITLRYAFDIEELVDKGISLWCDESKICYENWYTRNNTDIIKKLESLEKMILEKDWKYFHEMHDFLRDVNKINYNKLWRNYDLWRFENYDIWELKSKMKPSSSAFRRRWVWWEGSLSEILDDFFDEAA